MALGAELRRGHFDEKFGRTRTAGERRLAIRRILDARFSLSTFEEMQRNDPVYWDSPRNDMARGLYGQAMREMQRLESAPDGHLDAEIAAITPSF